MEDLRKRLDNFLKEQGYSPIDVTVGEKKIRIARVEDPKAVYAEFEAIKQELVRLNGGMRPASARTILALWSSTRCPKEPGPWCYVP